MKFHIRPANPETDYHSIAALWTTWTGDILSADDLYEEDEVRVPGKIRQRLVAVDVADQVVGVTNAVRYPSEPEGRFHGYIYVSPSARGIGAGRALYEQALIWVRQNGAGEWHSRVQEGDTSGMPFAQKRGFTIACQVFDSVLDLTTFDETLFTDLVEAVEGTGIRFFTFDSVSADPAARRKLYEINRIVGLDEPGTDSYPSYETWEKIVLNASWFHHDCEFIAAEGERFVGLSGAFPTSEPEVYEMGFTGVDPAYRSRKIAQALKFINACHAKTRGAKEIRTANDSRNTAMLAVNKKLGYKRLPGYYVVISYFV